MKKSETLKIKLNALKVYQEIIVNEIKDNGGYGSEVFKKYESQINDSTKLMKGIKKQIEVEERRELEVGDGVTYHSYSDSYACTIIKRTPKTITIQKDKATLNKDFKPEFIDGGFVGHCVNQSEQSYTYERDPEGHIITARWSEKRGGFVYMDNVITVGRNEFYDYNF